MSSPTSTPPLAGSRSENSEPTGPDPAQVAQVRAFNRFYTRSIGVLGDHLAGSPFSLAEARVLYELAHHGSGAGGFEGAELRRLLDLDAGYLSRILARFESAGLVSRRAHPADARRQLITLTDAGRATYADLDERQVNDVRQLLEPLSADQRGMLTEAMGSIRRALGGSPAPRSVVLRPPGPGDLGWIVSRHGALYVGEYGGDPRFEAMVARIVADYAAAHDPVREAVWIAEVDGRPVGSIACMAADPDTAKLRLLLVEPSARGLGVGERLVAECVRFAGRADYRRITLWTTSGLAAARRIYQRAGFVLEEETPTNEFGSGVIGQTWSRGL
ncbi:MAG TPA: bifunctional helix-turn-helix transcriptional regulator/GNAT family N-acetyltransferase [Pseudonocardia sp.]|jgi:DNA-binding MarR family transcriptional regulator/GNAT superfamily N-acetyltransferase|nr:bifunctional helix-turn-helix transcriptional regulator/GNAT family N-acetyltransferase [Pseudonocardia sp.]